MRKAISRFLHDEAGLEVVEWALVGGMLVAVGSAIFTQIGSDVGGALGLFQAVTQQTAGTASGTGS